MSEWISEIGEGYSVCDPYTLFLSLQIEVFAAQIRFILSNTEELHGEIQRLRGRVKELETALSELQAHVSTDPHPLLRDSVVLLSPSTPPGKRPQEEEEVLIDTFGSLTIGPDGSSEW